MLTNFAAYSFYKTTGLANLNIRGHLSVTSRSALSNSEIPVNVSGV